ncbi:hypothetical protein ACU5AY_13170 [Rhizobium sp. PAMB 3174]
MSDGSAGATGRHSLAALTPWLILLHVLAVGLLVTVITVPPVLDYPNHYVRFWLLAGGINEAPLSSMYSVDWSRTVTNIGVDLVASLAGPILGADVIAKLALFLSFSLPTFGAIVLNRHLAGRWHPWQLAILFFAWSATSIGGFMNFQIGLGLALIFAWVDCRISVRRQIILLPWRAVAFGLLLIVHAFPACFFLLIIGALEFGSDFTPFHSWRKAGAAARRIFWAALACAIPLVLIFALGPAVPGGNAGLQLMWNDTLQTQLLNIASAFWSYDFRVDYSFLVLLCIGLLLLRRSARGHAHAGLLLGFAALCIFSVIAPRNMLATGWISWRFPIMAALVGMAAFLPGEMQDNNRYRFAWVLIVLAVFGRMAWVGSNWIRYQDDVNDVIAVVKDIPAGSAVLQAGHVDPAGVPFWKSYRHMAWSYDTYRHVATLAVPIAHSFVPTVFTAYGKQPLEVRRDWRDIDVPEDNLIPIFWLACKSAADYDGTYWQYLANWRQRFDYVLVLNADLPDERAGFDVPDGLDLVHHTTFADLFRVAKNRQGQGVEMERPYCSNK